jgi:uncharacterized protein (TIGR02611 family)
MTVLKKTLVLLVGGGLLLAGLAMLVLPGPAFLVIPAALAILAIEFVWARRWLAWLRERLKAIGTNKSSIGSTRHMNAPNTARTQQR